MAVPHYFWVPAAIAIVWLSGLVTVAVVRPSVFRTIPQFRSATTAPSASKVEIVVKQEALPAPAPASAPVPAREEIKAAPPAPVKKVVKRKAKPGSATAKLRKDWVRR